MKVSVDDQRCRGHGVCTTLCPEVFTLSDDGFAVVKVPEVPNGLEKIAQEAVESCPENAISETEG